MKGLERWSVAGFVIVAVVALGAAAQVTREEFEQLQGKVEDLREQVEGMKNEMRTRRLVIEDEKGEGHIGLGVEAGIPALFLNEKGETRVGLMAAGGRSGLSLYDEKGKRRVTLSVDDGNCGLSLYDEKGKRHATLGLGRRKFGLFLLDSAGRVIWRAP